jgi:hypothetical protein
MKFEKSRGQAIDNNKMVRVKQMNHIVEVVSIQSATNGLNKIQKLSKTHYVLKDTGEIKEYKLSKNRGQNIAGLKKSFRRIRDLINNNFTGHGSEIHVTLTYAENMTDPKRLYSDFEKFWKRYKYKYGKNCDYISVVEPQGRGAWHCHVLIRHNDVDKLYIPSDEMARLWGHGFIKIRSLKGVDNIGAYLSAYLGDVELTEETLRSALGRSGTLEKIEIKEVEVNGNKKRYIKGGRLHLYPPGMNIYRKSKGIVYPEVEKMRYGDIKKIVGNATHNYSTTVTIQDDAGGKILNRITYEHYNMKRRKDKPYRLKKDLTQDPTQDLKQDLTQDLKHDITKSFNQLHHINHLPNARCRTWPDVEQDQI